MVAMADTSLANCAGVNEHGGVQQVDVKSCENHAGWALASSSSSSVLFFLRVGESQVGP